MYFSLFASAPISSFSSPLQLPLPSPTPPLPYRNSTLSVLCNQPKSVNTASAQLLNPPARSATPHPETLDFGDRTYSRTHQPPNPQNPWTRSRRRSKHPVSRGPLKTRTPKITSMSRLPPHSMCRRLRRNTSRRRHHLPKCLLCPTV